MGCCEVCLKAILIITNIVVMLAGLVLLIAGGVFMSKKFDFFPELEDYSTNVNAILIPMLVIGAVLLLVGLIGCIGAISGKAGLLNLYFVAVLLVVIAEIVVIILAAVYKDTFKEETEKAAKELFEEYLDVYIENPSSTNKMSDAKTLGVNVAQYLFSCCGLTKGPSYWKVGANVKIPPGCCDEWKGEDLPTEGALVTDCAAASLGKAYDTGCTEAVEDLADSMGVVIIVVVVVIIVFQIILLAATCYSKKAGHMDEYA